MRQISARELKSYLDETPEPPLLLDVREPWEFHTCHLEPSTHIPMGQLWGNYRELDPQQEIVVICHHGIRSQRVCFFLEQYGFSNVINLAGGLDAWARDVDPAMPVY